MSEDNRFELEAKKEKARYEAQQKQHKSEQYTFRALIAGGVIVFASLIGAISYNNHLNYEKKIEFYQTANSEDIENYFIQGYLP